MSALEDAIGCWTVNKDFNSLPVHAKRVTDTTKRLSQITQHGNATTLRAELELLRKQLDSMVELTYDAIRRCEELMKETEL